MMGNLRWNDMMTPDKTEKPRPDRDIFLDALLQHAADNIYFKDMEGRFLCASHSLARWFGLPDAESLIGKTDRDFFSIEHARQAALDEAQVMKTGTPIIGKIEKETWLDGSVTWVSTSKLPLFDRFGQLIGIQGISRDVTAQQKANEKLAQLAADLRERNEAYERDLKLAAEVLEIFGQEMPRYIPLGATDATATIESACCYQPATSVGGDFYMAVPHGVDRIRFLVCDVMGHGMQAALVAVLLRIWAKQTSPGSSDIGQWVKGLNERLVDTFLVQGTAFLATAIVIEMNINDGSMFIVNAGHPETLRFSHQDKTAQKLVAETQYGPALGLIASASYPVMEATLHPGDKLVLYTDGLTECLNPTGEEFQEERLIAELGRSGEQDIEQLVHTITASAAMHRGKDFFDDDFCVIALQRRLPT